MDNDHVCKVDKAAQLADSVILKIAGRVSGPLMLALGAWILNGVSGLKTDVATISANIQGVDTRVHTLEDWRNGIEAYADEVPNMHHK